MSSTIRGSDNFDSAGGNACKAWVNFNGVTTAAIRASYNVSSVTRTAAGLYTVTFTTALSDANYSIVATSKPVSNGATVSVIGLQDYNSGSYVQTASAAYIGMYATGGGGATADSNAICVSVFR